MNKILVGLFLLSMFLVTGSMDSFAAGMEGKTDPMMGKMDHSAMMKGMDPSVMSEEQKAAQARMQEFSTPNANHEVLKSMAGSWKTNVQFWMDANGQPQETEGTSEAKMILDGHFLEQTFIGTVMGQPFEGRGIYGYDNLRKEYTGLWFDNMSTGIMVSASQYNPATKAFVEEGTMSCPITNEAHRWFRAVTILKDADNYTYETFMKGADGKEFRSMLITYTRNK